MLPGANAELVVELLQNAKHVHNLCIMDAGAKVSLVFCASDTKVGPSAS